MTSHTSSVRAVSNSIHVLGRSPAAQSKDGFEVLFLSLCSNRELPRLSLQLLKYADVCK